MNHPVHANLLNSLLVLLHLDNKLSLMRKYNEIRLEINEKLSVKKQIKSVVNLLDFDKPIHTLIIKSFVRLI